MDVRQAINELKKEFPQEWQNERRIEFLKERISSLIIEAWSEMDKHKDYVRRNRLIETILTKERLEEITEEILKTQAEIIRLKYPSSWGRKDEITPEMIANARAYPFSQLYQFNRNAARCPFHEDHTPSFMLMKDNTAKCFGACDKSWDTIAFLMQKDGLRFPEAVRALQ
ncbi:MAG: DNA primase [Syntrophorhabdus sp. PtaB.Bin006]|nr:MAG: DNA primase [Syntrophorhabdus sp. PtaB.Bin006]OPY77798.1 MAG: DNA primase [Syntrophorhabdus sp. PtaU1.Bin153]